MPEVPVEFAAQIARLGSDRESGASEILGEVIRILRDALGGGAPVAAVARALCRAQPSMAPVWNAALEAVASAQAPERFERFARRVAHAPAALARFAVNCLTHGAEPARLAPHRAGVAVPALRLVTFSYSSSVLIALDALARTHALQVACSEGRPALEGRRLASRLAAAGTQVTYFSDAAIGHALASADAVLVGADAVAPEWFLNKSGTRMLAAAAVQQGVAVYVLATRDKFVSHPVAARLVVKEGASAEIWEAPPAGVAVRNPYFESIPLDLVASVISDVGVLGTAMVPDVGDEARDERLLKALDDLSL
jgi:methylthioribose-1-phosphate isomerase